MVPVPNLIKFQIQTQNSDLVPINYHNKKWAPDPVTFESEKQENRILRNLLASLGVGDSMCLYKTIVKYSAK